MLTIDTREKVGDRSFATEYAKHFNDAETLTLEAGDFSILNADGELVGIERKTIGDLLRVIADKRFVSEQLSKFMATYSRHYLLVEGAFKPDHDGQLLIRQGAQWTTPEWGRTGGWRYSEMTRWVISVTEGTGIQYQRTVTPWETMSWLHELHVESQKPREKRRALAGIYEAPLRATGLVPPSRSRRVARVFPGIGDEKAALVADHFGTPLAQAVATEKEWAEVPGIGKTLARRIYNAWRER